MQKSVETIPKVHITDNEVLYKILGPALYRMTVKLYNVPVYVASEADARGIIDESKHTLFSNGVVIVADAGVAVTESTKFSDTNFRGFQLRSASSSWKFKENIKNWKSPASAAAATTTTTTATIAEKPSRINMEYRPNRMFSLYDNKEQRDAVFVLTQNIIEDESVISMFTAKNVETNELIQFVFVEQDVIRDKLKRYGPEIPTWIDDVTPSTAATAAAATSTSATLTNLQLSRVFQFQGMTETLVPTKKQEEEEKKLIIKKKTRFTATNIFTGKKRCFKVVNFYDNNTIMMAIRSRPVKYEQRAMAYTQFFKCSDGTWVDQGVKYTELKFGTETTDEMDDKYFDDGNDVCTNPYNAYKECSSDSDGDPSAKDEGDDIQEGDEKEYRSSQAWRPREESESSPMEEDDNLPTANFRVLRSTSIKKRRKILVTMAESAKQRKPVSPMVKSFQETTFRSIYRDLFPFGYPANIQVEIRPSDVGGWGVFATRDIPRETVLDSVFYTGKVKRHNSLVGKTDFESAYVYTINKVFIVDAVDPRSCIGRYVNSYAGTGHRVNSVFVPDFQLETFTLRESKRSAPMWHLKTLENIVAGSELFITYGGPHGWYASDSHISHHFPCLPKHPKHICNDSLFYMYCYH